MPAILAALFGPVVTVGRFLLFRPLGWITTTFAPKVGGFFGRLLGRGRAKAPPPFGFGVQRFGATGKRIVDGWIAGTTFVLDKVLGGLWVGAWVVFGWLGIRHIWDRTLGPVFQGASTFVTRYITAIAFLSFVGIALQMFIIIRNNSK